MKVVLRNRVIFKGHKRGRLRQLGGAGYDRKQGTYIDIGAIEYEYPGTSYKIVKAEDSEISVEFNECIAFPNPVENGFTLMLNLLADESVDINIINSIGKSVYYIKIGAVGGRNSIYVDRNMIDPGIYFVTINSKFNRFNTLKLFFN